MRLDIILTFDLNYYCSLSNCLTILSLHQETHLKISQVSRTIHRTFTHHPNNLTQTPSNPSSDSSFDGINDTFPNSTKIRVSFSKRLTLVGVWAGTEAERREDVKLFLK